MLCYKKQRFCQADMLSGLMLQPYIPASVSINTHRNTVLFMLMEHGTLHVLCTRTHTVQWCDAGSPAIMALTPPNTQRTLPLQRHHANRPVTPGRDTQWVIPDPPFHCADLACTAHVKSQHNNGLPPYPTRAVAPHSTHSAAHHTYQHIKHDTVDITVFHSPPQLLSSSTAWCHDSVSGTDSLGYCVRDSTESR